jgi:peptidylamidoglycolate lyase
MERKEFIKHSSTLSGACYHKDLFAKDDGPVYGHGNMRYRMDKDWSKADSQKTR